MENSDKEVMWFFEFGLEKENGEPLERAYAEDLLKFVITWAEENGCQIGGGYRNPKESEI